MKTAVLVGAAALALAAVQAPGSLWGVVNDNSGGALPGVTIVAASGATRERTVTNRAGRYEFTRLAAGSYDVTASLSGFTSVTHKGVAVSAGGSSAPVNFSLCVAGDQSDKSIDWVVPRSLEAAWKAATLVADVRITATGLMDPACPDSGFEDLAEVVKVFKQDGQHPAGRTLRFMQERWREEPAAYPVGVELVVFLGRYRTTFARVAGPWWVFSLLGPRVVSPPPFAAQGDITRDELFSRLRALAGGGPPHFADRHVYRHDSGADDEDLDRTELGVEPVHGAKRGAEHHRCANSTAQEAPRQRGAAGRPEPLVYQQKTESDGETGTPVQTDQPRCAGSGEPHE